MTQRHVALALAVLPLAILVPSADPAPATAPTYVPDQDFAELVAAEVARASERDLGDVVTRALELRGADRLGSTEELDRALDAALGAGDLGRNARILLVTARLLGEEPDGAVLAEVLEPLIASDDDALAVTVAGLFGDRAFRTLPRQRKEELAEALLAVAADAERAPAVRMAFAKSAFAIRASGASRNEARGVLRDFLQSDDPALRGDAALALAASAAQAIEGPVRIELERLERVPDQRGTLAGILLNEERVREHYDRKLRDQRELYESGLIPESLQEFVGVLEMVRERHLEGSKVEEKDLVEAAIDGMLLSMDAHSSFMPSETYERFLQELEAEYGGIGAYVNTDPDTGLFTIVQPIYSGPAYEAGLKTDDKIVRIDDWPTLGKDRDEIIKRLKGKPGTTVKLYVWRRGMEPELIDRPTEDMVVNVERALVEIPAGSWQLLPGGIGLIELNTFSRVAMEELKSWIPAMMDHGMKALVLDMRRNSGGLLTEAREVADLFLDKGRVVVSTEDRVGSPEVHKTRRDAIVPPDMPIVIVTGRLTASAAEIVSGALQDHERATLVGRTTFGKGSVQQLLPLIGAKEDRWDDENHNRRFDPWEKLEVDHDGDGEMDYAPRVKLTIARYLLPSGRSIHRELDDEGNLISMGGVEPDVEVKTPPIERWQFEEERKVLGTGEIAHYVDEHWDANRELFGRLAVNDGKNPDLYPDFDALMTSLNTGLSRDSVRSLLRGEIRRRVQDDRGAQFPWGDFVEDVQIQKAIEVALEQLGSTPADVPEFGLVFDFSEAEVPHTSRLASLGEYESAELRRARALIQEAQASGDSNANLTEVLTILEGLEEN